MVFKNCLECFGLLQFVLNCYRSVSFVFFSLKDYFKDSFKVVQR